MYQETKNNCKWSYIRDSNMSTLRSLIVILLFSWMRYCTAIIQNDVIRETLRTFCPMVDICDGNATSADLRPNGNIDVFGRISCCQGCSCHSDCKHKMNCCYLSADYLQCDNDVTYPVCTYMRVGTPDRKWDGDVPAYLTISTAPSSRCIDVRPFQSRSGETVTPSCGSQPAAYWGDLFPVLSHTSMDIYKNEACARCHGIADYELFRSSLVCDKFDLNKKKLLTMIQHVEMYERRLLSPYCYIKFELDASILQPRKCVVDKIATCIRHGDVSAPIVSNLSFYTMQTECENGVYAPVKVDMVWYRNVFCAMCSVSERNIPKIADIRCSADVTSKLLSDMEIIMLLDTESVKSENAPAFNERSVKYPQACIKDGTSWNESTCRKVHCPTGMIYNRKGICDFFSSTWITPGFYINIKLAPVDTNVNLSISDSTSLVNTIFNNSPWSARWMLSYGCQKYQDVPGETDELFTLGLVFNGRTYSIDRFVKSVKQALAYTLEANINGSVLQLRQSILKYGIGYNCRLSSELLSSLMVNNTSISKNGATFWTKITDPLLIKRHRIRYDFNILYLCEQVDLSGEEFDSEANGYLIKNKLNGRWMFKNEFELIEDKTGSHLVRVCLSDTPLEIRTSGSTARSTIMHVMLTVTVMLWKI